jgi:hypothetical protein
MSDETITTERPVTLDVFPVSETITIDGTEHRVMPFKVGKTMLMLEFVTELLRSTNLVSLVNVAAAGDASFVSALLEALPDLLANGSPVLSRAIALTLTSNEELKAMTQNDLDIRVEMDKRGRAIQFEMDTDQMLDTVVLGIRAMNLNTLRQALPKLGAILAQAAT